MTINTLDKLYNLSAISSPNGHSRSIVTSLTCHYRLIKYHEKVSTSDPAIACMLTVVCFRFSHWNAISAPSYHLTQWQSIVAELTDEEEGREERWQERLTGTFYTHFLRYGFRCRQSMMERWCPDYFLANSTFSIGWSEHITVKLVTYNKQD